jgi:para-nitrobenzyl esterase
MSKPSVRISQGTLVGTIEETRRGPVQRFLGIPYAEPPVGANRFGAAKPSLGWDGEFAATAFGHSPIQETTGPLIGLVPGMGATSVSEDCLTLNVWRPDDDEAGLPVLVWIYGGAFVVGGTAAPSYDGAVLAAEQRVVLVSINYRVGALGFTDLRAHGGGDIGAVTNAGLRDQILGAQWVKQNISAFGGDPERITVFGESAGAGSITYLMNAPQSRGVFRRAISQSPGVNMTQQRELSTLVAQRFLDTLDVTSAEGLLDVPAERVLRAQVEVINKLGAEHGYAIFHPVVDDDIVPAGPVASAAHGSAAHIDLLIGSTSDEMRLFLDPRASALGADGLAEWTLALMRVRTPDAGATIDQARLIVRRYIALLSGSTRTTGADVWSQIQTDGHMRLPIYALADAQSTQNPNTYAYSVTWQSHNPKSDLGAFHAIDIPFAFDAFDRGGWGEFIGVDEDARRSAHAMRSAWRAFAATGDPSCEATGPWPKWDRDRRSAMVFGQHCQVIDDPVAAARALWDVG